MTDMFMMLQISGAGDELQGIKRGIMEMADVVAITKADGENIYKAELAKSNIVNALMLFPLPESGWRPHVFTCSAVTHTGLVDIWDNVLAYMQFTKANGYFTANRNRQSKYWMYESINETLQERFYRNERIATLLPEYEERVLNDNISSFAAAKELLDIYFK
jgi:LAO/AO transport system kinase